MRILAALVSGFWLLLLPASVAAQDFPNKPIRLIVPFPPGGPNDIIARVVGQRMSELTKQPVVIDNRSGQAGVLGTEAVAKSSPDGYTIGIVSASALVINPTMEKVAYDAAKDLARRRPQSADAHWALSYVLRYAGMQEQATQECNAARSLDPGNSNFRSCAWAFLELGKTDKAMDFVHLDPGTEWAAWVSTYAHLAAGNVAQARESVKSVSKAPSRPCAANR